MHLSVFGQLGHLERLDSIFYFLKASENQLTHSETKYFEQHKVEKILFICKMCLNLNCNRKVFENWVQPGSVMGVAWQSKWNVWKGSYSKANKAFAQWFVLCEHCLWLTQKLKQKIRSVTEVQKSFCCCCLEKLQNVVEMGNLLFSMWIWKSFVNSVPKLPICSNFVFVFVYLKLFLQ